MEGKSGEDARLEWALKSVPSYPDSVNQAIASLLPSEDPLDAGDFDVISYFNSTFPTDEELLGERLDAHVDNLQARAVNTRKELLELIEKQSRAQSEVKDTLETIMRYRQPIVEQFPAIESQTQQLGQTREELCRDVDPLRHATRNLTAALMAVEKTRHLDLLVVRLNEMVGAKDFLKAAQEFQAADDYFAEFVDYLHYPFIQQSRAVVEQTKKVMIEKILRIFAENIPAGGKSLTSSAPVNLLSQACVCAEVLNPDTVIDWFAKRQLSDVSVFSNSEDEACGLDQLERRFAWIRRRIREVSAQYKVIFPPQWCVMARLAQEFCMVTRQDVAKLLEDASADATLTATRLVSALKQCLAFEKDLTRKFTDIPVRVVLDFYKEHHSSIDQTSIASIVERYMQIGASEGSETEAEDSKQPADDSKTPSEETAASDKPSVGERKSTKTAFRLDPGALLPVGVDFSGVLTELFDTYMRQYPVLIRKQITGLLRKMEAQENFYPNAQGERDTAVYLDSGNANPQCHTATYDFSKGFQHSGGISAGVSLFTEDASDESSTAFEYLYPPSNIKAGSHFDSCDQLFLFVKESTRKCRQLNTGEVLFALFKEYQRGLEGYLKVLTGRIPRAYQHMAAAQSQKEGKQHHTSTGKHQSAKSAGDHGVLLLDSGLRGLLLLINTLEYMQSTLPELAVWIQGSIDESFQEFIDLSSVAQKATVVLGAAIEALAGHVLASCQPSFRNMVNFPWANVKSVGDQSRFVTELNEMFQTAVGFPRMVLSAKHFQSFCRQCVKVVIPGFFQALLRCRDVPGTGAVQMSVDAHVLKDIFMGLPNIPPARLEGADTGLMELSVNGEAKSGGTGGADLSSDPQTSEGKTPKRKRKSAAERRAERNRKVYETFVKREMGRVESFLLVAHSRKDALIAAYYSMVQSPTPTQLKKLLDMRGFSKKEQIALVDAYNKSVPPPQRIKLSHEGESRLRKLFSRGFGK